MFRLLKNRQNGFSLFFALLILCTSLSVVIPNNRASAATQGSTFLNGAQWQLTSLVFSTSDIGGALSSDYITRIGGGGGQARGLEILNAAVATLIRNGAAIWTDSNSLDGEQEWILPGCGNSVMRFQEDDFQLVNLRIQIPGEGCDDVIQTDLIMSDPNPPQILNTQFDWIDSKTIVRIDGRATYKQNSDLYPDRFFDTSEEGQDDQDFIDVFRTINNLGAGNYTTDGDGGGTYGIMHSERADDAEGSNNGELPGVGDDGGGAGEIENTCANVSGLGGFALRWLFCPLLELMDKAIVFLDEAIQSLLFIEDPSDPNFAANSELHNAWGRIRNISLLILVPIMLVMVIGTALGVSFLDAYTVRRAMPRFLIAIVFISTSWYITAFLINLTNSVGNGILGLMTGPFGGPAIGLSDLITVGGSASVQIGGVAIFGALLAAGAVSFGIIVSYAFIAGLILLLGFVLLSIRQLLILTLVLFAPLAILSWIFPNNDKLWKLWWGTFSKMLIMFPLIMILIGGGRIFAFVVSRAG